jgi:hypothetical protein
MSLIPRLDDYAWKIVFSFLDDERDRDAIFHVSRQFRKLYHYVAPNNAYVFALASNNVFLARRIFDVEPECLAVSDNMLRLAFMRNQVDHARFFASRFKKLPSRESRLFDDLMKYTVSNFSQPLYQLLEESYKQKLLVHSEQFSRDRVGFNPDDLLPFFQWILETKRFFGIRSGTLDILIAAQKSIALLKFVIDWSPNQDIWSLSRIVAIALSSKTAHYTDSFLQYALDCVKLDDRSKFMSNLVKRANFSTFSPAIFTHLIRERRYDCRPLSTETIFLLLRAGENYIVYDWLAAQVGGSSLSYRGKMQMLIDICIHIQDAAVIERCVSLFDVEEYMFKTLLSHGAENRFVVINALLRRVLAGATVGDPLAKYGNRSFAGSRKKIAPKKL